MWFGWNLSMFGHCYGVEEWINEQIGVMKWLEYFATSFIVIRTVCNFVEKDFVKPNLPCYFLWKDKIICSLKFEFSRWDLAPGLLATLPGQFSSASASEPLEEMNLLLNCQKLDSIIIASETIKIFLANFV